MCLFKKKPLHLFWRKKFNLISKNEIKIKPIEMKVSLEKI